MTKRAGTDILVPDKIDFKLKIVKSNKEGHSVRIKGSMQHRDTTAANIYVPSIGTPKYIKPKLPALKGQREVTHRHTESRTLSNGENRQGTKREAVDVSNAINQRNLTDICKSLC